MKKISLYFLIILATGFFLFSQLAIAQEDNTDWLSVTIKANVKWEEILKGDDGKPLQKTSGRYVILIEGLMKLNEKGSPAVSKGGIAVMPLITFDSDVLNLSMKYEEEWHDVSEYKSCTNSLIKQYKGEHFQQIKFGPTLTVCNFSSAMSPFLKNLTAEQKKYMKASEQWNMMPNYYQFAIGGGELMNAGLQHEIRDIMNNSVPQEITMKGVKRNPDCGYEEVEKRFPGFTIGLQMSLPKSRQMSGEKSWQADSEGNFPPTFGIHITDLDLPDGEEPFTPPLKYNGNVTYSLEWEFR